MTAAASRERTPKALDKLNSKALDKLVKKAIAEAREQTIPDTDVKGLRLRVRPSGATTWGFMYRLPGVPGKPGSMCRMSLGTYPEIGLGEARAEALEIAGDLQRWRRNGSPHGLDPASMRRRGEEKRTSPGSIADATEAWLATVKLEIRPKTLEAYKASAKRFREWAEARHIARVADVTRAHLADFRTYLVSLPRHSSAKGGVRGKKVATKSSRSPAAINRDMRGAVTMLNALRREGSLPNLDRDAIADLMCAVKGNTVRPSRLTVPQIAKLLTACDRHDAAVFKLTRAEHHGDSDGGTTPRHTPIKPFVHFMLMTGCRLGEALTVTWDQVQLDTLDANGNPIGQIELNADDIKTRSDRTVFLNVAPSIRRMLAQMRLRSGGEGRVWADYSKDVVVAARKRLHAEYGAPEFLWSTQHSRPGHRSPPTLRSTCATFLHCSPGIYGANSLHMACAQLGHSTDVARKHYAGVEQSIPRDATTLEAAMRIEDHAPAATAMKRRKG